MPGRLAAEGEEGEAMWRSSSSARSTPRPTQTSTLAAVAVVAVAEAVAEAAVKAAVKVVVVVAVVVVVGGAWCGLGRTSASPTVCRQPGGAWRYKRGHYGGDRGGGGGEAEREGDGTVC